MRYIEIGERSVFLQIEPQIGPIVCAAMPGSQPGCEVNLSEILLEIGLTTEGHQGKSAAGFGIRLGRILSERLCLDTSSEQKISGAFACILHSMQVGFTLDQSPNRIQYQLSYDPLERAALGIGSKRGLDGARQAFNALCKTILRIMAPEWSFAILSEEGLMDSTGRIEIVRR
jgi:hypothetical protein